MFFNRDSAMIMIFQRFIFIFLDLHLVSHIFNILSFLSLVFIVEGK